MATAKHMSEDVILMSRLQLVFIWQVFHPLHGAQGVQRAFILTDAEAEAPHPTFLDSELFEAAFVATEWEGRALVACAVCHQQIS